MNRILTVSFITVFLTALLVGGAAAAEWTPVTVTDFDGNQVTLTEKPDKIISLAPACTEIIYAVGAGDRVVGNTTYCNYPEEAKSVEKIGGFSTISTERIITLCGGNSIVFANPENGKESLDYLKQHGCTVVVIDMKSVDDIYKAIDLIGTAVGCKENADKVNADIKSSIEEISAKAKAAPGKTPTVMHALSIDPYYISGKNTFQDELISLAGGVNAFADVDGWGIVTLERLLIADPDIILTDAGADRAVPGFDSLAESFRKEHRLSTLSAVKNDKVFVVDADIFDRGGPRVVEALETLVKIIHPEIFGEAEQTTAAQTPGFAVIPVLGALLGAALLLKRR
ncbi:MAG: helical backbone metal receptor [Methanocorpusculum sp.]|nr:helical backbone metal receptor [Methanocorpusculum sp.]